MKSRVVALGAALCLLSGPALVPAGAAGAPVTPRVAAPRLAAPAPTSEDDPLAVTLQSLRPAVLPRRGTVQLSGAIVNNSDETWTDLKIYPWRSTSPITDVPDLEVASETDPRLGVGTRVIADFDEIDEIAPGGSATYHVRIPRDDLGLTDEAGVYWIGVQVLGSSSEGRDDFADGRVRTFIPLLPRRPTSVQSALIVPIRHPVSYARDGSLSGLAGWIRALQPGGQLRNLIRFVGTAPNNTLTVLVDPAVLDAIGRLAGGNPPRDLGPADTSEQPSQTPSQTPGPSASRGASRMPVDLAQTAKLWAGQWLDDFDRARGTVTFLSLPYGDPDLDAAAKLEPTVVQDALSRTDESLRARGVTAQPAVSPPSGYLSSAAIEALPLDVRLLLSADALDKQQPDPSDDPTEIAVSDHLARLWQPGASAGGPQPGNTMSVLQVRQRLLAETALRSLTGAAEPLVMSMPPNWNPGVSGDVFFPELALPWLSVDPEPLLSGAGVEHVGPSGLDYPQRYADRELTRGNLDSALQLIKAGETLQGVLTRPTTVATEVLGQALATLSYSSRDDPARAQREADAAYRSIEHVYDAIRIKAPQYVTQSSNNGRFRVDLTNDLDQAVTVRLEALTDPALVIEAPGKIKIRGHSTSSILVNAHSHRLGVHEVTLLVTDLAGTPLGPSATLPIRASQVARVIWVIIAGGAALLFGAIAVRLYRKFRRYRVARAAGVVGGGED